MTSGIVFNSCPLLIVMEVPLTMAVTATLENQTLTLTLLENLTALNAAHVQAELMAQLTQSTPQRVILDLQQIQLVDSMGLKIILGLHQTCQQAQIACRVAVNSTDILRLFELCKLDTLLAVDSPRTSPSG